VERIREEGGRRSDGVLVMPRGGAPERSQEKGEKRRSHGKKKHPTTTRYNNNTNYISHHHNSLHTHTPTYSEEHQGKTSRV